MVSLFPALAGSKPGSMRFPCLLENLGYETFQQRLSVTLTHGSRGEIEVPMIKCSSCGTKYNTDLVDKCPICEYRASEIDLVRQAQASDPSTDPATLGQMALSDDPRVA